MKCICRDQVHPSLPTRMCPQACLVRWVTESEDGDGSSS